jgi:hypothetical protein
LLFAIDHRTWKTGLPVRSAVLKPCAGRLVVGWVTTSESLLLIVLLLELLEYHSFLFQSALFFWLLCALCYGILTIYCVKRETTDHGVGVFFLTMIVASLIVVNGTLGLLRRSQDNHSVYMARHHHPSASYLQGLQAAHPEKSIFALPPQFPQPQAAPAWSSNQSVWNGQDTIEYHQSPHKRGRSRSPEKRNGSKHFI